MTRWSHGELVVRLWLAAVRWLRVVHPALNASPEPHEAPASLTPLATLKMFAIRACW